MLFLHERRTKPRASVPADGEPDKIAAAVPPMAGSEYLTMAVLADLWQAWMRCEQEGRGHPIRVDTTFGLRPRSNSHGPLGMAFRSLPVRGSPLEPTKGAAIPEGRSRARKRRGQRMPASWRMNRLRTPAGEGNVAGKGPNGGSNVVWDTGGDGNARSTAQLALRLPGNPAACYRSSRSRVHLRNVDSIMRRDRNDL